MKAKYGNKKTLYDGILFDSKREAERYIVLLQAQESGLISDLKCHPKFELIPKVTKMEVVALKTKEKRVERTVQLSITYTADFSYQKNGVIVVEDVKISKSMLPKEFLLKEKLFRWKFGFPIKRVFKSTDEI